MLYMVASITDDVEEEIVGTAQSASTLLASANWPLVAFIFSIFGISLLIVLWILNLVSVMYSCRYMSKPIELKQSEYPAISILKPLAGGGRGLYRNLESFFQQTYPKFELLLCVHSATDPAASTVRSLMQQYPDVDARLFISGKNPEESLCYNPKVENLLPGYKAAKYDLIMISDCGVIADNDGVLDMVNEYVSTDHVGMVWQHPIWTTETNAALGFALNQLYHALHVAKLSRFTAAIKISFSTGGNCLIHREALESCGGLVAFGKYMGEDHFMDKLIRQRGWKVRFGTRPAVLSPITYKETSVRHFFDRLLRWKRLRLAQTLVPELFAPLLDCISISVIGSYSISYLTRWNFWLLLTINLTSCFIFDWGFVKLVHRKQKYVGFARFFMAWVVLLIGTPLLHIVGPLSREISWRGKRFRLIHGGTLVPITISKKSHASQAI